MTGWFTFILALGSLTFAWQAYRGISKGSTNLPLSLLSLEEYDRNSIYFWGVLGLNVIVALALGAAAVLLYMNDWGSVAGLSENNR